MSNRKPISQKTRFTILKRDNFRCQYCGRTSEDGITIEVDHIIPLSNGGTDEEGNLITACKSCNRGKRTQEVLPQESDSEIISLSSSNIYVPPSLSMHIKVECRKCGYEWAHTIDEYIAICPMCEELIDISSLKRIVNKSSKKRVRTSGVYIKDDGRIIHRDEIIGKSIYW